MKHFDLSQWADFARDLVSPARRQAMDHHLAEGCRRCARTLRLQRTVVALADADRRLAAPDFAVRQIKGFFALNKPERHPRLAPIQLEMCWDSGLEPALAGVRGGETDERQVHFASAEFGLALRIAPFSGRDALVTGHLASHGGAAVGRVPAYLVIGDRVVDQALADEDGHFELQADLDQRAELWLELAGGGRIAVAVEPVN